MARVTHENTKVYWVPTIAAKAAPTVAEITAGTDLTALIPVDGVNVGGNRNNASQAMLGDAFVTEQVGTWGRSVTLTFVKDDGSTTVETLFTYGADGYIVINRLGGTTAQAGKKVEVYPVEAHKPMPMPSAENEYQKLEVQFAVTSAPADATVAA